MRVLLDGRPIADGLAGADVHGGSVGRSTGHTFSTSSTCPRSNGTS